MINFIFNGKHDSELRTFYLFCNSRSGRTISPIWLTFSANLSINVRAHYKSSKYLFWLSHCAAFIAILRSFNVRNLPSSSHSLFPIMTRKRWDIVRAKSVLRTMEFLLNCIIPQVVGNIQTFHMHWMLSERDTTFVSIILIKRVCMIEFKS